MSETKLKPCPFCGGEVEILTEEVDAISDAYNFHCDNCDMSTYYDYCDREQAIEHALKIAQDNGIEELEREVRYRSQRKVPLNVSRQELIACAREFAYEELYIIATAMAKTLAEHVKLPMSMLKDYLKHFNDLVAVYHEDNDKYKADQKELSVDYRLNEMCREYTEENGI